MCFNKSKCCEMNRNGQKILLVGNVNNPYIITQ